MYSLLVCSEYIVSIILLIMALTLFKNNISRPVQYIQFTLITMFLLNVGYLMEIQCISTEGAVIAIKTEYCGSVFISTFMVFVVMEYLDIRLPQHLKYLLVSVDVAMLIGLLTNDYHNLFFESVSFDESDLYPHVVFTDGIIRNVFAYYTMVLGVFMVVITACFFINGKRGGRKVPVYFVITMLLPVGAVILHLTGIMGVVDLSPLVIGISGICMYIFLRNDMIFEVVNVAAGMVMDNMQDAFIVMDTQMKLLDLNKSAKILFPELCDENSDTRYV